MNLYRPKKSRGTGKPPKRKEPTKRQRHKIEQREMKKKAIRRHSNTKGARAKRLLRGIK